MPRYMVFKSELIGVDGNFDSPRQIGVDVGEAVAAAMRQLGDDSEQVTHVSIELRHEVPERFSRVV